MKKLTVIIACFALIASVAVFAACSNGGKDNSDPLKAENVGIIHEPEFGGVYITLTIDDFNAMGFAYGDSVNIRFSNGYTLDDQPYYNGYYVDAGESLLVAYPGYDYIKAAVNYGADLWETAGLSESDTASVTLNEKGKYLDVQSAMDIHYSDVREDYDSDVIFANFRNIDTEGLKENILFRSASPCDNKHNRAPYVDALMKEAGVLCILNLSDSDSKIEEYMAEEDFSSPYFAELYEAGNVIPLSLNMNYSSDEFRGKIAEGLTAMAQHEGPYLVHCTEGKDRTGFVCMLLEAFTGASYNEIIDDYMKTYDNYYGITSEEDPARYKTIKEKNIDAMIYEILGDREADLQTADLAEAAEKYLIACGMTEESVNALRARLK